MTEVRVATTLADVRAVAADAPPEARLPVEVRLAVDDPFVACRRARTGTGGASLETTGGQSGWSYFGADPVERLIVGPAAIAPDDGSPTLPVLDGPLAGETLDRGDCDLPYPCGEIGWLSRDVARKLEALQERTVDEWSGRRPVGDETPSPSAGDERSSADDTSSACDGGERT